MAARGIRLRSSLCQKGKKKRAVTGIGLGKSIMRENDGEKGLGSKVIGRKNDGRQAVVKRWKGKMEEEGL